MKKVLFLMFAMLVLTLSSFGQSTKLLHRKYDSYYDNLVFVKKTPMSYQDWLTKKGYVDEYPNSYVRTTQTSQNKKFNLSSGDYLIKAKRQMISGYVFDFIGVGVVLVSPNEGGLMVGGACGLIGLICELSGIGNIGKAGLSLNENGVGVKVKF